jgi:four helix bundle protein
LIPGGSLLVEGPASIQPGGSARFTATLVEGSTRRDVTRDAQWSARGSGIAITEPGVATAQDLGFARIFVSYGPAYTRVNLAAKPAGTFVVMGRVAPLIAGAPGRVEVIDGPAAGRAAVADPSGEYFLVGVAGGVRVRASMLGHAPAERALVVNGDVEVDFSLTSAPSPDVVGRWRLLVRPDPECRLTPAEASATIDITRSSTPSSSFDYRLALPALPQQEPMWAKIIGTTGSVRLVRGWSGLVRLVRLVRFGQVRSGWFEVGRVSRVGRVGRVPDIGMGCAGSPGMATIKSYRELVCWQLAAQIRREMIAITDRPDVRRNFKFCEQVGESTRSAPANIAEGFKRTNRVFMQYLDIALGSLQETENHIDEALERKYVTPDEHAHFRLLAKRSIRGAEALKAYLGRCSPPAPPAGSRKERRGQHGLDQPEQPDQPDKPQPT